MVQHLEIETATHGRALLRAAPGAGGLIVGLHGYAETADVQLERLAAIPGADAWTLLSVQALHRFYRGRSEAVVASWMTHQDRDRAIADNIRYLDVAVAAAGPHDRIVYAGFSQGVAMAFRAAARGRWPCAGVIAVGGDVPPELAGDRSLRLPPVLLVRGRRDEWYTEPRFDADLLHLQALAVRVQPIVFDGAHEWSPELATEAGEFLASLQLA